MGKMKQTLALALCLIMGAGFAGCTSGSGGGLFGKSGGEATPKEAVTSTLDALKEGDLSTVRRNAEWESMELLTAGMKKIKDSDELMKAMFSGLQYEIKGEPVVNGERATVPVKITTKDIKGILAGNMLGSFIGSLTNKKEIDRKYINEQMPGIIKQLNASDVKKVSREIAVYVNQEKGKWKVELDGDLENALFGGASSMVKYYLRMAAGVTLEKTTGSTTTTTAPSTKKSGPSTTLSKEQREKASRVQASLLAELKKKQEQKNS